MYAVYRGTGATEVSTGFCLPRCRDGCCLLGFARGLLPCAYVLLLVITSVDSALQLARVPGRRCHGGRRSTPAPVCALDAMEDAPPPLLQPEDLSAFLCTPVKP